MFARVLKFRAYNYFVLNFCFVPSPIFFCRIWVKVVEVAKENDLVTDSENTPATKPFTKANLHYKFINSVDKTQ